MRNNRNDIKARDLFENVGKGWPDAVNELENSPRGPTRPLVDKIAIGARGEDIAASLLLDKGYRIIERNFRTKIGELDIVARDGETLVFVEVRRRQSRKWGTALDAVGWRKQKKVSRVAMQYLQWRRPRFQGCRFDVVGITGDEVVHIKDAWRLGMRF